MTKPAVKPPVKKPVDPAILYQQQLAAARKAFGVENAEAEAKAQQDAVDSQTRGQSAYIDAIRTALLGRDENTKALTAEQQRLTEQQFKTPTEERQRLMNAGITDPFERQRRIDAALGSNAGNLESIKTNLTNLKATREDLVDAGKTGYEAELDTRKSAALRAQDKVKEQSGSALNFFNTQSDRQFQGRFDDLTRREKEASIAASNRSNRGGGGGGLTMLQQLQNPVLAFRASGGRIVPKADGGFDFFDPEGKPITVEQAAGMSGGNKADFLQGSAAKQDTGFIQATKGKSPVSAAAQKDINSINDALNVLGQIESNSKKINTKSGVIARLGDPLYRSQGLIGANPDVKAFQSNQGFLSRIVRSMGEVGALNEGDIQRATSLIPQLGDTKEEAQNKIRTLRTILEKNRDARTGDSSYGPTLEEIVDTGI